MATDPRIDILVNTHMKLGSDGNYYKMVYSSHGKNFQMTAQEGV